MRKILFSAALAFVVVGTASAQEAAAPVAAPALHNQFVATNPLSVVLGGLGIEYERAFQENTSLAFSASTISFFDVRFYSATAAYRFFPGGTALQGFSIAGTAGMLGGSAKCDTEFDGAGCEDASEFFPTAGIELGYTWRLGETKRFIVQPTLGAKRFFVNQIGDESFSFAVPTGGIAVGYAF